MKEMRKLGSLVKKLVTENNHDTTFMCNYLECTESQYKLFTSGRLFLTYAQLEKLATLFNTTVEVLLHGDQDYYESTEVHFED